MVMFEIKWDYLLRILIVIPKDLDGSTTMLIEENRK